MTQEDKELLLKDLSARLPYGVVVRIAGEWFFEKGEAHEYTLTVQNDRKLAAFARGELDMKPYLRPMSSMTEKEKEEYCKLQDEVLYSSLVTDNINDMVDWLNAHHFDFRNLIERGLAIDCTNLNIY